MLPLKRFTFLKRINLIKKNDFFARNFTVTYNLYKYIPRTVSIFLFNNQPDYLLKKQISLSSSDFEKADILLKKKSPAKLSLLTYTNYYRYFFYVYKMQSTLQNVYKRDILISSIQYKSTFIYRYSYTILFNSVK